jgi:hypothetical protein
VRQACLPLLVALSVTALPGLAAGQDFPPPEQAGGLHLAEQDPGVAMVLAGGVGYAWPTALTDGTPDLTKSVAAGRAFHALGGVKFGTFAIAGIYRVGSPNAGAGACPAGATCEASATQKGFLVGFDGDKGIGSNFTLGLGWWTDKTRIEVKGSRNFTEYQGWALIQYFAIDGRLGDQTSPVRLGGYLLVALTSFDKEVTPAGSRSTPKGAGQPGWFEVGARVAFF